MGGLTMSEELTQQTTDQTVQSGGQDQTDTTTETVEEKIFKQDDVNNIVAKELKKNQEKLLKQLGVEDFENAKDGFQKFKEWQESQKTEAEKQQELLQSLETDKGTLSDENASLKAQISAMKAGVKANSVEDVVVLAKNLVNDDVDMDTAIKQIVEKYPHFAQGEQQQEEPKPSFTLGQHQKQGTMDAFAKTLLGK